MIKTDSQDPAPARNPLTALMMKMRDDDEPDYDLKSVRFVGIEFDKDEYKKGEAELNRFLEEGYRVIKDFQTSSGIVISLGKYEDAGCGND